MNETQNQPLSSFPQRRCVADYGVDDLPETWERFTILGGDAIDELVPQIGGMGKRFSDGLRIIESSGSKADDYHRVCEYARSWARQSVRAIHESFMALLGTRTPEVDRDSIENTIRQIVRCGAFFAYDARLRCAILTIKLTDHQIDDLTRTVQKQMDLWLRLWIDDFQDWSEPRRRKPSVELHGRDNPPTVNGKLKAKKLTAAQYDVVQALLDAGADGLTKDAIENIRAGARAILARLAKDDDWASVILMPKTTGKHYRLRSS